MPLEYSNISKKLQKQADIFSLADTIHLKSNNNPKNHECSMIYSQTDYIDCFKDKMPMRETTEFLNITKHYSVYFQSTSQVNTVSSYIYDDVYHYI